MDPVFESLFPKQQVFFRLPSPNSPPPPLPDDELSALLPKLLELQGERHLFLSNRQVIQTSITPELGITDDPVITTQNFDATIQVETPELDENLRKQLLTLLNDFNHLFAGKNTELGHTGLIKHTIDTQEQSPFRLRSYRSALKARDEMKRQVQEMLAANVIKPSLSPWASPVVLVEKKGGEQRFCVDYRRLNSLTKKDSYPLPRIDDTFDMLHGKQFFTTLDLASDYWEIELEKSAKEKTAFIVENNLYELNRMSFGLCNAPATFQRLMSYVLRDVLGICALVYLDDVIIFSDTFENHLIDIRSVFELLKSANLKLKLKKCQFVRKTVNYLGI